MCNLKILTIVTLSLQFLFVSGLSTFSLAASGMDLSGSNTEAPGYSLPGPKYPLIQDSYFTDDHGNILMIVNVLGEVNRSGQIVVQEDADFATIITLAGGLKEGANQKKVLVSRKEPDKNGAQGYVVDLSKFFAKGDRSSFINLKPNDTIIIPEKGLSLEKITRIFGVAVTGVTGWYYIKNL